MTVTREKRLEQALKWALEGNHYIDYGSGMEFRSKGCGCCAYEVKPPEYLRPVIAEVLGVTGEPTEGKTTGGDK